MPTEDETDIARVLNGDQDAMTDLFERYQRRLLGLLVHACGCRETAEDLVQESFARAFTKLHLFEGRSSFYTWLCRVAMNLLINERRRKRIENQVQREGFEMASATEGSESSVEHQMEQDELRECVHGAIAMLDVERRSVLLLRDFDGLDYEQIAETLQIPLGQSAVDCTALDWN